MTTDFLNEELEKIDVVRERTGLNFEEARELLDDTKWDVMEALVLYEQELSMLTNKWEVRGSEVVAKVKQLIKRGNVTNIRIKTSGRTVMELPVTLGLVGSVLAPKLALFAGITCLLTKCTIEFDEEQLEN